MGAIFGHCRRVLGGMQFGAVAQVPFWVAVGGAADCVGAYFPDSWKP